MISKFPLKTFEPIVTLLFTEYDVARGILKLLCKTWEFRATSYSVNSPGIITPNYTNSAGYYYPAGHYNLSRRTM